MSEFRMDIIQPTLQNFDHAATIYFLHGFRGDAYLTWQLDPDNKSTLWPRWLAETFPNIRVVVVGYKSPVFADSLDIEAKSDHLFKELRNRLDEIDKPFMFICHSMGGIITKRALLLAGENKESDLLKNIRAIVFYATPHSGSDIARCMNTWLPSGLIRNRTLRELASHGSYLKIINRWYHIFVKENGPIAHIDFCETKRTKIFRIVDSNSSRLYNDESTEYYESTDLGYNHSLVCKLTSTDDFRYKAINSIIKRTFCNTKALNNQRNYISDSAPKPIFHHVLWHYLAGFIASLLGLLFLPTAWVINKVESIEPHPLINFALLVPMVPWFLLSLLAASGLVVTYALNSRSVVWHFLFGALISSIFMFFAHYFYS